MHRGFVFWTLAVCLQAAGLCAQDIDAELKQSSEDHMREELGVNPITTPSIQDILKQLELFRPVPIDLIDSAKRDAVFNNRLQTAMHFGSLVADGFMLTLAERPKDVQDVGKALIRQARALGVGERLTKRSKSLLELSDKGDWLGMRQELVRTQQDVETSMLELRDEEMAHMISLGGWLRGFEISTIVCADNYSPQRAAGLMRPDVMEYFLARLDTLDPRLKSTELVTVITSRLQTIRAIAMETPDLPPSLSQVERMRDLAVEINKAVTAKVDDRGRLIP